MVDEYKINYDIAVRQLAKAKDLFLQAIAGKQTLANGSYTDAEQKLDSAFFDVVMESVKVDFLKEQPKEN